MNTRDISSKLWFNPFLYTWALWKFQMFILSIFFINNSNENAKLDRYKWVREWLHGEVYSSPRGEWNGGTVVQWYGGTVERWNGGTTLRSQDAQAFIFQ